MKHAISQSLNTIKALLKTIRKLKELKEKQTGIFYKSSQAFLHFHKDPKGLFADLKIKDKFKRFPVNNATEKKNLIMKIKAIFD